jgi:hypothetical protein
VASDAEQQLQASAEEDEPQAETSGGGLPTWGRHQGRHTSIHFCQSSQRCKKSEAPHINKDRSPLAVLMLFFTDIFLLLVEQTNLYYQQHWDGQAGPIC